MNKGKVERNKKILELRLFDKLSNQEIADIYGISRQRVSRLCILWAPRFGLEKELEELHIELDKQRMNGILQKLFKKLEYHEKKDVLYIRVLKMVYNEGKTIREVADLTGLHRNTVLRIKNKEWGKYKHLI